MYKTQTDVQKLFSIRTLFGASKPGITFSIIIVSTDPKRFHWWKYKIKKDGKKKKKKSRTGVVLTQNNVTVCANGGRSHSISEEQ